MELTFITDAARQQSLSQAALSGGGDGPTAAVDPAMVDSPTPACSGSAHQNIGCELIKCHTIWWQDEISAICLISGEL